MICFVRKCAQQSSLVVRVRRAGAPFQAEQAFEQIFLLSCLSALPQMSADADKVIGSIKSNVGGMTGNHSLQAKGEAQNAHGHAEREAVAAKNHAEGAMDGGKGNVKKAVGSLTGNEQVLVRV